MFSLVSGLPSSLSADGLPPLFEQFIGTSAAVRLLEDVHVGIAAVAFSHRPLMLFTLGASEVSRFSCKRFLNVLGVCDYAGLTRNSRYRS